MKTPDLSTFDWRDIPWRTAIGVGLLSWQAYVYFKRGNFDGMNTCIGLAIGILGLRRAVGQDQKATQAVSDKIDDAHAAVVEAHSAIARTEAKMDAVAAWPDGTRPKPLQGREDPGIP